MQKKTIAVHGATGSQSKPVTNLLEAAGHSVRRLSRSAGVDLFDRHSLESAYMGADTVMVQFPLIFDERALVMADNVADAVAAAGVKHLVINASSPLPPQPIGVPGLDARHRVAAADVPMVTMLQPTLYLENLTTPWQLPLYADGIIAYPLPAETVRIPWVATDDVAQAIKQVIDEEIVGSFVLPGHAAIGSELADAISSVLGRTVKWQTVAPDKYRDMLLPHLGEHAATSIAANYGMLAAAPSAPEFDPEPARAALDWAPRDAATWASEVPAFRQQ